MTLTLTGHMGNMGSAHPLVEVNVSFKFEGNPSISKGVIERTRKETDRPTDRPTGQSESSIAPPTFCGGGIIIPSCYSHCRWSELPEACQWPCLPAPWRSRLCRRSSSPDCWPPAGTCQPCTPLPDNMLCVCLKGWVNLLCEKGQHNVLVLEL